MPRSELQRMRQVFEAALEQPADERESFLGWACGRDPKQRAKLMRLLECDRLATESRFLDDLIEGTWRPGGTAEAPPDRIGRYPVIEELGRGSMGVVYLAEDPVLARRVALKLLPERLAGDAKQIARLTREARVLAKLNHPNIARIHSSEEVQGRPFLVLEFVEGSNLSDLLRKGPLPVESAVNVLHQVALAIEAAHAQQIVHRDLKPSNVVVNEAMETKVLDFGLAKSIVSRTKITTADTVVGTSGYIAPERLRGESASELTDVFAFGCLAYECLTGRPVFDGCNLSDLVAGTAIPRPNWKLLPGACPAGLVELVESCLLPDPGDRLSKIRTARVLLESLRSEGRLPDEPSQIGP